MFWEKSPVGKKFALHADICNLGLGFLATDYVLSSELHVIPVTGF